MTLKQEQAIDKLGETKGNVSQAMILGGYSPKTAHNPEVLTKSKTYKQKMGKLLKEHGVTKAQYVMNIGEAMQATKQNQFTGEITPDHTTRLAANKQAEKLLFDDQPTHPNQTQVRIPNEYNEVEAQRLLFRKTEPFKKV